jgi:hypothetical protein
MLLLPLFFSAGTLGSFLLNDQTPKRLFATFVKREVPQPLSTAA